MVLRTARVYPEELPNLPDGSQQNILGRYLPEGRDQVGEVIVTGRRGGRPARFQASVSLKDAEEGNSFIPRLWARAAGEGQAGQRVGQRGQPEPARAALPGALLSQVTDHASGLRDRAAAAGNAITMPAPSAPPAAFRRAWVIGTGQAASVGSHAPK